VPLSTVLDEKRRHRMKRSKFSEEQVAYALRQAESGLRRGTRPRPGGRTYLFGGVSLLPLVACVSMGGVASRACTKRRPSRSAVICSSVSVIVGLVC
jgi:hypothetical protein